MVLSAVVAFVRSLPVPRTAAVRIARALIAPYTDLRLHDLGMEMPMRTLAA